MQSREKAATLQFERLGCSFFFLLGTPPTLNVTYLPPRGGRLALGLSGVSSGDLRSLLGCRALEVLTVWRFSGARGGCESVKEQGGSPPAGELAGGVAVRPSGIRWKKRWRKRRRKRRGRVLPSGTSF